jgi:hypothetical protein
LVTGGGSAPATNLTTDGTKPIQKEYEAFRGHCWVFGTYRVLQMGATFTAYYGDQKLSIPFDCCFDALALCERHSKGLGLSQGREQI